MAEPHLPNNCPINEITADRHPVGRCCFYLKDGVCERHGDVSKDAQRYRETGKLTSELELIISRLFRKAMEGMVDRTPEFITIPNPFPGILEAKIHTRTGEMDLKMKKSLSYIKMTINIGGADGQAK